MTGSLFQSLQIAVRCCLARSGREAINQKLDPGTLASIDSHTSHFYHPPLQLTSHSWTWTSTDRLLPIILFNYSFIFTFMATIFFQGCKTGMASELILMILFTELLKMWMHLFSYWSFKFFLTIFYYCNQCTSWCCNSFFFN